MKCDRCGGGGYTTDKRRYKVLAYEAWIKGYCEPKRCTKCGGSGFILSNANEVLETLKVSIDNRTPPAMRQIKQIYN